MSRQSMAEDVFKLGNEGLSVMHLSRSRSIHCVTRSKNGEWLESTVPKIFELTLNELVTYSILRIQ